MRYELVVLMTGLLVLSMGLAARGAVDSLGDPLPDGAVQRLGNMRMRYGSWVSGLAYLPDGRGIVLQGGGVDIWDLAEGKQLSRTDVSKTRLMSVKLRPDGKVLLLADGDGIVYEWDYEKMEVVRRWDSGQKGLRSARYSPDGKRILVGGSSPLGLREFLIETGENITAIETPGFATTRCGAIYGPEGKTAIMGGGYNHLLEHRDLATGELLHKWGSNYEAKDIKLSPDGTCLLVGVESHAVEWKLADYSVLHRYDPVPGEAGRVFCHDYAPARNEAVLGVRTGGISRYDRESGKEVLRWMPHSGTIYSICVSPDSQHVLSYGGGLVVESDMDTGEATVQWDRHDAGVEAVAFTPDGKRVVSGSQDCTLRVWDPLSGKCELLIKGATLGAYAVAVSPDGKRAAAGCKDSVVREFSLADGALLRELKGHRGYVRSVAYSHDGKRLFSSADDGSVCVWEGDGAEPVQRLEGHLGGVLSVAVSANDKLLLSGGRDGTVRVWDLVELAEIACYKGQRGWVESVLFVGNDRYAMSAGRDGRMLRWNLDSGKLVGEMTRGSWLSNAVASPDGMRVYVADNTWAVTCWDVPEAKMLSAVKGHAQAVSAVALSPDGKYLVTGSADATLLVWDLAGK
jgi:WD40 repeat protein